MRRFIILTIILCALTLPAQAQMHEPTWDLLPWWPWILTVLGLAAWRRT